MSARENHGRRQFQVLKYLKRTIIPKKIAPCRSRHYKALLSQEMFERNLLESLPWLFHKESAAKSSHHKLS